MSVTILGLHVKCPKLGAVFIERENFAIGPMSSAQRRYVIRCNCGKVHNVRTQQVSKPTLTKAAVPLRGRKR